MKSNGSDMRGVLVYADGRTSAGIQAELDRLRAENERLRAIATAVEALLYKGLQPVQGFYGMPGSPQANLHEAYQAWLNDSTSQRRT